MPTFPFWSYELYKTIVNSINPLTPAAQHTVLINFI